MRIGSGFDVHAFGPGDSIILGGVRIPHTRGVIAHSDGDVILHALCDAMLGAAGLGDIGMHFPDTDPVWKGAESRRFVAAVREMLGVRKLKVGNADVTLLAQTPKVSAYRLEIRRSLAHMLRRHREPGEHQGDHHRAPRLHRAQRGTRGAGGRVAGTGGRKILMIPAHWRDAALAPPVAWGAGPLATGTLRSSPEDFQVIEILGFEPSGAGPHALLTVRKRGANTEWVARELARVAGCRTSEVGFAGLKDRNAVTTQAFTVPRGQRAAAEFIGAAGEGYEVIAAAAHQKKLPRGALQGNPFRDRGA
jgi:2-C-methyl-D-erythritol 2,4-cyclodiphosphate synthase